MRGAFVVFSFLAAFATTTSAGDIYRCVSANGDVMYTNIECPANSTVQHVASYTPVPPTPIPEYSQPTLAPAVHAQANAAQAQAAYQAGYAQAQADAQAEQPRDEGNYATLIPYYPVRRVNIADHHHHERKAMAVQSQVHSRPVMTRVHS
jgi:hypothetical protein